MDITDPSIRREIKYVSNELFSNQIYGWLLRSELALKKHYPDRIVNNVYYDTHKLEALSDNLDGISRRDKLRYRWYGSRDQLGIKGKLEIKKRKNAYGAKEAIEIFSDKKLSYHSELKETIKTQIPSNWRHVVEHFCLPVMINTYKRSYFISKCNNIRVTLDRDNQVFDQRQSNKINIVKASNLPDYLIIEIKFHPDFTEYVSNSISDIPMRISRNSKYVNSVMSILN